jgi:hypothetical protein
MSRASRTAGTLAIVASGIVLLPTAGIALGYIRRQGLELTYVLPLLPPVVAITAVVLLARMPPHIRGVGRGAVVGLASGATLYVALSAVYVFGQHGLISRDGTAFWGLLIVPAVWVWPPLTLGGIALGVCAQLVARRVTTRRGGDA